VTLLKEVVNLLTLQNLIEKMNSEVEHCRLLLLHLWKKFESKKKKKKKKKKKGVE
jgi:hypothetical protein